MPPKSFLARKLEEMPGHRPTWDFFEMGTTTRMGRGPSAGEQNNKKRLWAMEKEGGKTEENSALRNVQHRRWKSGKEERNKRARGRSDDDCVGFFVCSSLRSLPPPSSFVGHRKMGRVFGLVWSPPPDDR